MGSADGGVVVEGASLDASFFALSRAGVVGTGNRDGRGCLALGVVEAVDEGGCKPKRSERETHILT